jgi:hypothetical protein
LPKERRVGPLHKAGRSIWVVVPKVRWFDTTGSGEQPLSRETTMRKCVNSLLTGWRPKENRID